MLRRFISKFIGFPLQDIYAGTQIIDTFKFLLISQYWSMEKLEEYRINKMQKLINHAYNNVPFYKIKYDKFGINIKSIQDFNDFKKLPVITKEDLRKYNKEFISNNLNNFKFKIGKTGGTTGPPVITYKDTFNRSFTWGSYYRWYNWIGINYYDSTTSLWGVSITKTNNLNKLINSFIYFILNFQRINTFKLNSSSFYDIFQKIDKFKPAILHGYLSSLLTLADFMKDKKLKFSKNPLALSSTTETLLPHHRVYLEKTFKSKIYDQYGCGEVSAIAYECSKQNGLHINQEHVHIEILNEVNLQVINETGRIIATDLDNLVMPFIRFETGDNSILTDKICSCGVNQPLLERIEGRTADTIILADGSKVHGVFFTIVLHELNILASEIPRFQIYQKIPGEIEFRVEIKRKLSKKSKENIKNILQNHLNKVEIIEYDELPIDKSGKFRYIISDVK